MSNNGHSIQDIQRILGVKEDTWYGPVTKAAMAAWQAEHLPDLPEVHRGYLVQAFWDKAAELGWVIDSVDENGNWVPAYLREP